MGSLFPPALLKSWDEYRCAAVELAELKAGPATSLAIFTKERSVEGLKTTFNVQYDRWCGPKPTLRLAGGREVDER